MIIHHKEDFSNYQIRLFKKLKYSDTFSFIPLKIINKETRKIDTCIFQTPYLFVPYGLKKTINNKTILDLSFLNKENDKYCCQFLKNLEDIFQTIKSQFSDKYQVNHFCKDTLFNECMRLKVAKSLIFNQDKQKIDSINSFSYGTFLIHLHGLWINDKKIWFQWYLIQAKIIEPLSFQEYSFIDEIQETKTKPLTKYDKMLKMGIPKEAVERQKQFDSIKTSSTIPPPPPLCIQSKDSKDSKDSTPKITASDLQNIVLRKGKSIPKRKLPVTETQFEPPSLEELQITLSKLKKIN